MFNKDSVAHAMIVFIGRILGPGLRSFNIILAIISCASTSNLHYTKRAFEVIYLLCRYGFYWTSIR